MGEDREAPEEGLYEGDEFELDAESSEDIESAMLEALEAVEHPRGGDAADGEGALLGKIAQVERARDVEGVAEEEAVEDPEVANLREELAEMRERSVRTLADFDNFRKRVERDRHEDRRYAGFEVIREVLAVVDNLERAVGSEGPLDDLRTGVEMILRQTFDILRRHGVRRIEAVGEPFDPRLHEAVARQEEPEVEVPTVREELQAGYTMHDRLLRPATVNVAMPVEEADAEEIDGGVN